MALLSDYDRFALTRRKTFAVAAGGVCALAAGCDRSGSKTLWAADAQPDGYPTVQAVRYFAKRVEEKTGGRMKIAVYPGGQMGAEKDTLEITVFGGLAFNRVNIAPLNSIAAETLIPSLPFLFRSINHMRAAMDGAPGEQILASLAPHDLVGLCFYDSGARSFYNTKRDIYAPDDLKGLKIRVQNSDLYVAMVEGLGGNATPIPYGEVYQGLLQGVIDGAENNWPSYESSRHFEVAKHYSLTRHVMAPETLLMSAHAWKKLTEDDQQMIVETARESVPVMRKAWDARVAAAQKTVLASDVKVIEEVDREAFVKLMEPVWARFVNTPVLKRLVEDIQSVASADA